MGVVIEGGRSFTIGDTVIMEIRLSYNGPKVLLMRGIAGYTLCDV